MKGNAYIPFMRFRGDGSTLNLDFTGGSLDPRVVLTRSAATATYINSSGYVATTSANEARFDYDPATLAAKGLLIEGTATNVLSSSQNLSNASYWTVQTAYTSVSTTETSPSNAANANLFTEPNTTAARSIYQSAAIATGTHTASVFIKYNSGTVRGLRLVISSGSTNFSYVTVNMSTGAIVQAAAAVGTASAASATVTAYPNSWYRITLTTTLAATSNFVFNVPVAITGIGTPSGDYGRESYAGNSSTFSLWGSQFETGTSASSYIPTTTAQVTRNPDLALMTSTNFSSWFTAGTTGTFFVDFHGGVRGLTSTVRSVISTSDQTTKHLHLQQASAAGVLNVADFGAVNSVSTANTITSGARTKGAFNFDGATTTVNLCLNGGTVATSSAIAFSVAPTWLVLGATSTNGTSLTDTTTVLNGSIRQIKYYPTALTSAQLIAMTT